VNVFYDPSKTDTATLLKLIKNRNCRNARHITDPQGHALNPIIAAGDPVQLRIPGAEPLELTSQSQLPGGWRLAGQSSDGKGAQIVTFATPVGPWQGNVDLKLQFSNGTNVRTQVAIVSQIGQH